jgi:hypothetical protein
MFLRMPIVQPGQARMTASCKEQAAAGLRPPPLPVLIEGAPRTVNAFPACRNHGERPSFADKALTRLNFRKRPGNA